MLSLLLFVLCVSCSVFLVWKWRRQRKRMLELAAETPTYKGCLPLIGNAYCLCGDTTQFWELTKNVIHDTQEAGGVMAFWLGPSLQYIITDPDDAFTILNTCLEKSSFYKLGAAWVNDGLIVADAHTWKRNRKLLNPTFSQHVLDGFLQVFNAQAKLLTDDFQAFAGKGPFDPRPQLTDRTLETICQTAIGINLEDRSLIDKEYKRAVEKIFDIFAYRVSNVLFQPQFIFNRTHLKRQEDKLAKTLHNMSRNVLQKRKEERKNGKLANTSARRFIAFLDLLLDMAEDGMFTDEQIRQELDTMIAAGHDTSSRALLYTLIVIGTYPEIQDKLYKELETVLGTKDDIDRDDLTQLVYLEAVVKETLRLTPVTPIIARDIDKEVKLKNYTLAAGSGAILMFYGIHRLPIWGPDAEVFRPERWLEPDSLPKSPGAYCAFSVGRRNCIGKSYAYMAMKTTLAHIIRRYKVKADYNNLKVQFEVLLKAISGFQIELETR